MVKGERRKKREEIRRIVAEDDKRRKDKAQKKASPRKTNYRRDKEGNVILFGNLRMSKLSILVLVAIGGIVGFLYLMSTGVGEMEGYIEPEFSFESCQEAEFNPDMCKFYYKFCRTYDDGGSICKFAEEDPWVNYDRDENRWTEEEQDFLPPTQYDEDLTDNEWNDVVSNFGQFILPMVYGEGRAESEPVCYSTACKQAHPNLIRDGTNAEVVNKTVEEAREALIIAEDELRELEKNLQEYNIDKHQLEVDFNQAKQDFKNAEEEFKDEKTAYRHALDVKPHTRQEVDDQKLAIKNFHIAETAFAYEEKQLKIEQDEYDAKVEQYFDALAELGTLQQNFEDALDDLTQAKINNRKVLGGDNKFVNIVLSKTCLQLIENELPTYCPTYRELKETYDNTLPNVSGEWVDLGYDISRDNPTYKNYWHYYNQIKHWKVITVDPDSSIMQRGITITIQPNDFTYIDMKNKGITVDSINTSKNERYEWNNIYYSEDCKSISIAPSVDISTIINNVWENCSTEVDPQVFDLRHTVLDWIKGIWNK